MKTGSIQRDQTASGSSIGYFTAVMTGGYSLAIFLIAFFALISFLGLYISLKTFETSAAVINVSGRQRMLSQRIGKLAHDLIHEEEKEKIRVLLKENADLMEKSHEGLIAGDSELGLPGAPSPAVRAIYFKPPLRLDKHVVAFVAAARALAEDPVENLVHGNPYVNLIEDESHNPLLQSLDTLVRRYQKEAEIDITKLQALAGGILALILIVLVLESLFIFRPLTRRIQKKADKLAASENKLRDITSALGEGVYVSDKEGRVTFMNPEAERLMGWSEKELLGKLISEVVEVYEADGKPIPVSERLLTKTLKTGAPHKMHELRIVCKDGTFFFAAIVVTPIKNGEGITGAVIAFHDIKKRKQAEGALRASKEKAEEATKIKDKFVSLVAHDLRTPLTVIIGMMGVLVSKTGGNLSENQKNICRRAIKSGENMVNMIDRLLDISKLQTGRIKPERKQFDIHITVNACIEGFKPLADEKEIQIISEIPEGAKFHGDPYLIGEVINNLIGNSVKFCGSGDKITVFVPSWDKPTLAVKDSGAGIKESVIKDLFKHEEKTSGIGTAGEKGTGLGLPLSYDIIKAHGGELTVESIPGAGCIFCITLLKTV
ncbi:MAG TPA: PAS domain S-box protein [Nitrospirae bacterium]|nr:PAS domain S-box protein [Nitrospirota bacterium]